LNVTATIVFVALFLFVTWLGFRAAHWRKGDLNLLHEWGLGGRRFGTVVTWFLLGGDLYTAYTFIAVPALIFTPTEARCTTFEGRMDLLIGFLRLVLPQGLPTEGEGIGQKDLNYCFYW